MLYRHMKDMIQLSRAEDFATRTTKNRVVSSRWLGKLATFYSGLGFFRVAEVVVEGPSGAVTKLVTLEDNGYAYFGC
jgi:hypothetical protein